MDSKINIKVNINGDDYSLEIEPNTLLLDLLRNKLGLTGTKLACGTGECGACTVIMDGLTVNSCLVLAAEVSGKNITTIERLSKNGELHPLLESFMEEGAVQCGFCTPGMILSSKALLDKNPNPTDEEIKTAISGNLCRCTGYKKILKAIRSAAQKMAC